MTSQGVPAASGPDAAGPIVVDASVACKWFLPEVHSEAALRVLTSGRTRLAPDLIVAEVGNVLWKRVRTGSLTAIEAEAVLCSLSGLAIRIQPSWPPVLSALEIVNRTGRTVYDSLYLAPVVQEEAVMITGDERLVNALRGGPLASFALHVADC